MTGFTKRTKILAGVAVFTLLLVYPFKVTVMPQWNVRAVDENGAAVPGAYFQEFADQWTLDFHQEESICGDSNGEAHFPRHTVRASVLERVASFVSKLGPHSGLGPDVAMTAERLGYGDITTEGAWVKWNGWTNQVDSKFVFRRCAEAYTGDKCHFKYDYFFAINSSAKKIASCQSAS